MDLTSLWVLVKTRKEIITVGLIALAAFVTGSFFGRLTSPYYSSSPIVFNEAPCTASTNKGSDEELAKLQEQGRVGAKVTEQKKESPIPSKQPVASAVAGVTITEQTQNMFVASKNSTKYHDKRCSEWKRIKSENQVWFETRAQAEAAGYEPTKCTIEKLGL